MISMLLKRTDRNPHMEADMNHYKVRLKCEGRKMDLYFSTGLGWKRKPKLEDILDCLILDYKGKR